MGANDLPPSVDIGLRKVVCSREEIIMEAGEKLTHPIHQASVAAVLRNPWIGTGPAEDLTVDAAAIAPPLSKLLTDRLTDVLGGAENIEAFGKAAVVGLRGEIEHAGALIHTPFFGNLVREFLEGTSVLCFADTRSEPSGAHVAQGRGHPSRPLSNNVCAHRRRTVPRRDRRGRSSIDWPSASPQTGGPVHRPQSHITIT